MKRGAKILLSIAWGGVCFEVLRPFVVDWPAESVILVDLIGCGFPAREDVIETLDSPIRATGWMKEGFVLETGEVVSLPGINELPARSSILDCNPARVTMSFGCLSH